MPCLEALPHLACGIASHILGVQKAFRAFNCCSTFVRTTKARADQASATRGPCEKQGQVRGRICEVGPPQAVGLTSLARIRTSCSMGILLCEAVGCRRLEV
jgi:hypothetical protein